MDVFCAISFYSPINRVHVLIDERNAFLFSSSIIYLQQRYKIQIGLLALNEQQNHANKDKCTEENALQIIIVIIYGTNRNR